MKPRRAVVFSVAALLLATGLWVVGGNTWAARREERCDLAWTETFGSLDDLKRTYPTRDTNGTARKLEGATRGSVFDVTPVLRAREPHRSHLDAEWKRNQGTADFVSVQIAKPEASIDPPSEDVNRFLEEKDVALDAIESILTAGPPPEWSSDLSRPENEWPMPSLIGEIRLQRALMARALCAAHAGRHDQASRSLESSWSLDESLWTRPETASILIAMAGAHLQVGVLRKVNVEEDVWGKRLATLDGRTHLLDALNLDHRTKSRQAWWGAVLEDDRDGSWLQRGRYLLGGPWLRLEMAHYSDLMRMELARSTKAPLSDHCPELSSDVRSLASILAATSIPNIQTSFLRADRLVVDAELTAKILEARRLRGANGGRWPAAIPGIETSRFPGASWRYEVSPDGGRMSIAFSRELTSPPGLKPLPLRFSSN